jgi:hypothetical protein
MFNQSRAREQAATRTALAGQGLWITPVVTVLSLAGRSFTVAALIRGWDYFTGTFCFNSSNQLSTTLISVAGCSGSTGWIARKR